jgi:hypothetical protein
MLTSFSFMESTTPTSLDGALDAMQPPGYGVGTISGTSPPQKDQCELDFCRVPEIINSAAHAANVPDVVQMVDSGSQILTWSDASCTSAMNAIDCYLFTHICRYGDRVILKLNEFVDDLFETAPPAGQHFVYVIGESSAGPTDWTVFDPGWNPAKTSPAENLSSLSGHLCGIGTGFTTSDGSFRCFEVAEAETYRDPLTSRSALNVKANSPVELLLIDPVANHLGSLQQGTDVFEIPLGSYSRNFPLADDTSTGAANGDPSGIKSVYVPAPLDGNYTLQVTGTGLGMYTLELRAVATDGTVQDTTAVAVTNIGSTSTYQIAYSSVPNSSLTTTRNVTFQTALDDINDSLQLGLIIGSSLADRLSGKIERAAKEAAAGHTRAAHHSLKEFEEEVRDRTSRDINPIAVGLLLEDADGLLAQLPKPKDDDHNEDNDEGL